MARAHQHAAIDRLQRKNMARLHQVLRHGVFGDCGTYGAGAVGSRYASAYAFCGFNGNGKCGGVFGAIAHCHGRQLQALAMGACEGQANQATSKAGHEVDRVGADVVGGQYQIAFVFAVFFIDQDDHFALAHVGHDILHGGDGNRGEVGGGHRLAFGWSSGREPRGRRRCEARADYRRKRQESLCRHRKQH